MILIKNLSFKFNKHSILSDVTLSTNDSGIIGLVAPNGSGKTTFFRCITGLYETHYDKIEFNGISISNRYNFLKECFYLENSDWLYENLSVIDLLNYIKTTWNSKLQVNDIIEKIQLEEIRRKPIKKLSLGNKQKVLISMYMLSDVNIWFMDEPFVGLDPSNINLLKQILKENSVNKLILLSSHDLNILSELTNEYYFIKNKNLLHLNSLSTSDIEKKYLELYD